MNNQVKPLVALLACIGTQWAAADVRLPEITAFGQREGQIERKQAELQKIVISEEEVERYGDATVGDVLRRLPGMSFTGPAGVSKDVRMRGLDKGYTLFLINGEPVPGATQERQMQVDRLPADMIERIEIIRNPSAEYDAGGIGGTINIVLKNRAENGTRLRAAYGRNGKLDVGDVVGQWSHSGEKVDVVLAASHTVGAEDVIEEKNKLNAAGAVTEREYKPKPAKKTETLLSPRVTFKFGQDRLVLDPYFSSGTEDKEERSEIRNAAGNLTKRVAKDESKDDQLGRFGGRYEGQAAWGQWFVKAGIQQGRGDKETFTVERNAANTVTKRTRELENIREDQFYGGAGVTVPLGAHRLKVGVEQRLTDYGKDKSGASANNANGPLLPTAPGANDRYDIEETKQVFYLQDEWQLAKDHWLTPGLRYEHVARDATDRLGNTRSSREAAPNPSLHYRWQAAKDLNVRASVAQTLKMPKFDDVNPLVTLATGAGAGTSTNPDKGGNAALKPELAKGIEIGLEQFIWGNRGVLGLNFYHRNVQDYIEKQIRDEGGRSVQRPYNVGEARFWGAELDWRLPLLHRGAHELTLTGNHSELRGRVRNALGMSGDVKDLPPRITNIGIDWRHVPSKWAAGFSVNRQPEFVTDGLNGDGVREVKQRNASTLLDLYVTKVFSPQAELRLIAKNVLSVKKQEATTKYRANGSFDSAESKTERSRPTLYVTFESRF